MAITTYNLGFSTDPAIRLRQYGIVNQCNHVTVTGQHIGRYFIVTRADKSATAYVWESGRYAGTFDHVSDARAFAQRR